MSLHIWLLFLRIVSQFSQSDEDIVVYFREQYHLEPHLVDKPVHDIIGSQSYGWGIANWPLLIMPVVFVYYPFGLIGVYLSLLVLVTGMVSVMMAYLCGVNTERNVYMMNKIAKIAEGNEIKTACIITGGRHDEGLRELAHRFDGVELIE